MPEFALALTVFLAAHILPRATGLRDRLVARFGGAGYRIGYSILSLLLLAWVIAAALSAPYIALWTPGPLAYWVPVVAMPFALALLSAGAIAPNPLSISLRSSGYTPERPGIVAVTRHPVLWGFGLWAASHVPPNGDAVTAALFGTLALFAFAGIAGVERRARRRLGEAEWRRLAAPTAVLPRLPVRMPVGAWLDLNTALGVALGLAVYAALLAGLHLRAFGADPLAAV